MATQRQWESIRYFRPSEFSRPEKVAYSLLVKLDNLRRLVGGPIVITSDVRNSQDWSSHFSGHGVDVACADSRTRFRMLSAAFRVGFSRIGVYDRHLHLDTDPDSPQQVCWHGVSK